LTIVYATLTITPSALRTGVRAAAVGARIFSGQAAADPEGMDPLAAVLRSRRRAKVLEVLFAAPERIWRPAQLARTVGESREVLRREMQRLQAAGVLTETLLDGQRGFRVDLGDPGTRDLARYVQQTRGVIPEIRGVLRALRVPTVSWGVIASGGGVSPALRSAPASGAAPRSSDASNAASRSSAGSSAATRGSVASSASPSRRGSSVLGAPVRSDGDVRFAPNEHRVEPNGHRQASNGLSAVGRTLGLVVLTSAPRSLVAVQLSGHLASDAGLTVLTMAEWLTALERGDPFLRRCRRGRKLWVLGSWDELVRREHSELEMRDTKKLVLADWREELSDDWDEDWDPAAAAPVILPVRPARPRSASLS
jgi:hypothetical protein